MPSTNPPSVSQPGPKALGEQAAPPHVLLVNQFYDPGATPVARMAYDLAHACARIGMRVSVVAGLDDYSKAQPEVLPSDTVRVYWVKSSLGHRASLIRRFLNFAWFYVQASVHVLRCPDVDVIISLTNPPFLGYLAVAKKLFGKVRFVLWEMDLYPEALVAAGLVRERSLTARVLGWMNRQMLRQADSIVALGPYQKGLVESYNAGTPVHVIAPWDDRDILSVQREANRFIAEYKLEDKKIVLYAGNCGRGHSFAEILEVARRWKNRPGVCFVIAGRGAALEDLRAFQQKEHLANLLLLGYQPDEWLSDLLSCADVHLISMKPGWEGIIVPSKLFGIVKAGGAIGFIGPSECETAAAVRQGRFGFTLECGDADALERELDRCLSRPEVLASYRRSARAYHDGSTAAELAYLQWFQLLADLAPAVGRGPAQFASQRLE